MNKKIKIFAISVISIILMLVWHYVIMFSTQLGNKIIYSIKPVYILINIVLLVIPCFILIFLTKRYFLSLAIYSIVVTIFSIINYYTLIFHGSIILAGDFLSAGTALNVLDEYDFFINGVIKFQVCFLVCELVLILFAYIIISKRELYVKRNITLFAIVLNGIACVILFFSPFTVFDNNLCGWSWIQGVSEYGYEISLINSFHVIQNKYTRPDNYDSSRIACKNSDSIDDSATLPDIILILNETFCDIDFFSDVPESRLLFEEIRSNNDLISGYTTVSLVGGGTNNSEYELLTSNSMSLINSSAPFTFLDMTHSNTIVSYLKNLGYVSVGMHCGNAINYNRDSAYYNIGFDKVKLGKDSFDFYNSYGNRPWLDKDNYKDLINTYESLSSDSPRFMYLLTMQNHGGYQQNDSSFDTILTNEYGSTTDSINEYLTSIQLSIDAFQYLKSYFEKQERDTIVLMVGDHAPAFISELKAKEENNSDIKCSIAQRTVPYFVYSNMEIDDSVFNRNSSMVDLIPMILKSCNMPLSAYYKSILDLNNNVPVRTCDGYFCDNRGNYGIQENNLEIHNMVQNYFFMEYNNLNKNKDYKKYLFELCIFRRLSAHCTAIVSKLSGLLSRTG